MGQPVADPLPVKAAAKPAFLLTRLLPSCLAAALLYLGFFPVNAGWLGWVALVPLLWLAMHSDPRRTALAAWIGGFGFALAAVQWIRLANDVMYAGWILLALMISLAFPVFIWFTRVLTLRIGVPLVLAAPTAWVATEFIRAKVNVGFAWYYLGHTQHQALPVIQMADVFGAYGVSFLLAMVNVAVFEWLCWLTARWGKGETIARKTPWLSAGLAGFMLLLALGYGFWRLRAEFQQGPFLALVQGNLPQFIRNDEGEADRMANHYRDLADEAAKLEPDLIVWSETSWPFRYSAVSPDVSPGSLDVRWREEQLLTAIMLRDMGARWKRPTLLGLNALILEPDGEKHYNTAVMIDGAGKFLGRYDKIERVPFGEYIPYEDYLPIMRWLSPYEEEQDYGIAAGRSLTVFSVGAHRFGVLICYEDSVPHFAPRFLRQHPAPDFFLNISNDGWFHGSEEHEQHLVAARFRAVECRRAIGRAVNMGISCIIDGNGRIVALPGDTWTSSKNRTAIVAGHIPIDGRSSLYVLWGDVLPWGCWLVCLGGLGGVAGAWIRARRAA